MVSDENTGVKLQFAIPSDHNILVVIGFIACELLVHSEHSRLSLPLYFFVNLISVLYVVEILLERGKCQD